MLLKLVTGNSERGTGNETNKNFHGETHPILLSTVDLCLKVSSDFNYNFGFMVKEIFELGYTIKS